MAPVPTSPGGHLGSKSRERSIGKCYDVLEHVFPPPSVAELLRVLRPGGTAYLVFPVYFGVRSLPGLQDYVARTALVIFGGISGRGGKLAVSTRRGNEAISNSSTTKPTALV